MEQSLSSGESLMVLQIVVDPVAFLHSGDIYHFWENCQVCDDRGISMPLTVTPWLIQTHGSVCKCFFILVRVVKINPLKPTVNNMPQTVRVMELAKIAFVFPQCRYLGPRNVCQYYNVTINACWWNFEFATYLLIFCAVAIKTIST